MAIGPLSKPQVPQKRMRTSSRARPDAGFESVGFFFFFDTIELVVEARLDSSNLRMQETNRGGY